MYKKQIYEKFYSRKDDLDDLSCTDKKCTWKSEQKKVLGNYEPAPLFNHECFKKIKLDDVNSVQSAISQEITIKDLIASKLPNSAITQHV